MKAARQKRQAFSIIPSAKQTLPCKALIMSRFLYLNIYSFLLAGAGILALLSPFYLISKWTLIVQVIIAVNLFMFSARLFSTWKDKNRKIDILVKKNKHIFRHDTFEIFMQAPCGRLIVHQALKDLNKQNEYKILLKSRKPLITRLKDNCMPSKTYIFINEEAI